MGSWAPESIRIPLKWGNTIMVAVPISASVGFIWQVLKCLEARNQHHAAWKPEAWAWSKASCLAFGIVPLELSHCTSLLGGFNIDQSSIVKHRETIRLRYHHAKKWPHRRVLWQRSHRAFGGARNLVTSSLTWSASRRSIRKSKSAASPWLNWLQAYPGLVSWVLNMLKSDLWFWAGFRCPNDWFCWNNEYHSLYWFTSHFQLVQVS